MTYLQAVEKINSLLRFGIKPGLERILHLLDLMGNPQEKLRFVHVAGTNGKGTTCALIASVLKSAGYKTGLYTSPYITDFRERFQINGEMISEDALACILDTVFPLVEKMAAQGEIITEFELITAIALQWYAEQNCDVVVLEVGLGGRFDATNVIDCPLVSVIASISLDHTAILGDTLEKIAFEKCGIIKQGGTAVLYPEQMPEVFATVKRIAAQRGNKLIVPELSQIKELDSSIYGTDILYKNQKLRLPFIGSHQIKNAAAALAAIEVLRTKGFSVDADALAKGFAAACNPARLELLSEHPVVLLDGAHNPGAAAVIADAMKKYLSGKKIIAIMGMMADKDSHAALAYLAPFFSTVLTLRPENPRSLSAQELADRAAEFCADVRPMEDLSTAFSTALCEAGENGAVVICGSLYLAGEIRPVAMDILLKRQKL